MVQEPATTERIAAELREAEQEEMQAGGNIGFGNIPGIRSSRYLLRPEDEKAWIACWQLKVDRWGEVYGLPHRLPKGQLDHYMKKVRSEDGGPRFTLQEPPNVLSEPRFRCFVGDCQKRTRERALLIRHVESRHPQSAQTHKVLLDQLREAVIKDDPRVALLVAEIANAPDQPIQAVRVHGAPSSPAQETASPTRQLKTYACDQCPWRPKPDAKNPRFALALHSKKHRG